MCLCIADCFCFPKWIELTAGSIPAVVYLTIGLAAFQFGFRQDLGRAQVLHLSKLSPRMDTDARLKFMAVHLCTKIEWTKTPLQGWSVRYNFDRGEAFELENKSVPSGNCAEAAKAAPSQLNGKRSTCYTVPVYHRPPKSHWSVDTASMVA